MKRIKAGYIKAAFLSLALFSVCLAAGFFASVLFLPAAAALAAYLWIDKKQLRCPHCAGFTNLDRLFYARNHEYHCASCGRRLEIEE